MRIRLRFVAWSRGSKHTDGARCAARTRGNSLVSLSNQWWAAAVRVPRHARRSPARAARRPWAAV